MIKRNYFVIRLYLEIRLLKSFKLIGVVVSGVLEFSRKTS